MNRIKELEEIAFKNMTGEDITTTLEVINPKLAEEYNALIESGA